MHGIKLLMTSDKLQSPFNFFVIAWESKGEFDDRLGANSGLTPCTGFGYNFFYTCVYEYYKQGL